MEPSTKQRLEARVLEAVETMLSVADLDYLRPLSRAAFGEAIIHELYFLGLHAYGDGEARRVIQGLVEQHLDEWRTQYVKNGRGLP